MKSIDGRAQGTRSASGRGTDVRLVRAFDRVGGCCEPRTARGPALLCGQIFGASKSSQYSFKIRIRSRSSAYSIGFTRHAWMSMA